MKVRATQDGVYAGYYRVGPIADDKNPFPGEIFEIDDRPFPITDIDGKPVFELDGDGKRVTGKDGKPKIKMGSWFSPDWMERVSEDTPVTFDYPPFQIPDPYRIQKSSNAPRPGGVGQAPSSVI